MQTGQRVPNPSAEFQSHADLVAESLESRAALLTPQKSVTVAVDKEVSE